jgi:hypothetical protein
MRKLLRREYYLLQERLGCFFLGFIGMRLYMIFVLPFLKLIPFLLPAIENEALHHYHFGVALIMIAFVLKLRKRQSMWLTFTGLGIVAEEIMVILTQLGMGHVPKYMGVGDYLYQMTTLIICAVVLIRRYRKRQSLSIPAVQEELITIS